MILKKLPFSKILVFCIPILILSLLVFGFSNYRGDLQNLFKIKETNSIVEGVAWPSAGISPNEGFLVDPLLVFTSESNTKTLRQNISKLIFSSLFQNIEGENIRPELIETYTFDATIFKGKIRDNVLWSDGSRLTTADIIFTLNLIQSYGNKSFYSSVINGGAFKIEADDDLNFTISLLDDETPRQNQSYVQLLTFPILPASYFADLNLQQSQSKLISNFAKDPLGSGRLKINERRGTELELILNRYFFEENVKFDKYIFRLYRDLNRLVQDFRLKNIDLLTLNDYYDQYELVKELKNDVQLHSSIIKNQRYALYFNLNDSSQDTETEVNYFRKFISLRRSLLYILDRQRIIDKLENKNRIVNGPIDVDSWAYSEESINQYKNNPLEFEKTIKNLGFKKNENGILVKDNIPLKIEITYLSGSLRDKVMDEIKIQLENYGIIVDLVKISNTTDSDQISFDQVINSRTYQVILSEVTSDTSPDLYSEWHSSAIQPPGANISNYSNNYIDRVLTDARLTSNLEARKAEYVKFQRRFFDDSPAIYLFNTSYTTLASRNINFRLPDYSAGIANKYNYINEWNSENKYNY